MPNIDNEPMEEDKAKRMSWQESLLKAAQKPDRDALLANTILSASLATPVAEASVIGKAWMLIIDHQLDKAEVYKLTLPEKEQLAYASRIKTFKDGYHLLLDELIYDICMCNLSILGQHQDNTHKLAEAAISTMGLSEEHRE